MKKQAFVGVILAVVFTFSACSRVDLYQNLTEEDVNEILVLLAQNNIKALKKKTILQNEVSYSVQVSEKDMVRARELLLRHNLPRKRQLGLTGVYKDKGLIPTPDEQKARFLLALKGEIINSLLTIPQIVDADVVLNIPTKDEFASEDKLKLQRPTAAVTLRVRPEAAGIDSVTEPKVQQFVANAVEGLNPRDVTVIISYITTDEKVLKPGDVRTIPTVQGQATAPGLPPKIDAGRSVTSGELLGLKLDEGSKEKLKIYILIFFLLMIIMSSALVIIIVQAGRMRRTIAALKGPAGGPAIEGSLVDGPPRLESGENKGEEEL